MSSEGFWIDRVTSEIRKRKQEPIVLSTGKTPSGPIHIGSYRELIMVSALERRLRSLGKEVKVLFFVDSFDPMKSIPANLREEFSRDVVEELERYIGKPLCDVPDPYGKCHSSYAEHFAEEFISTFAEFGVYAEVIYSHRLYERSEMKECVRLVLKKLDVVKKIREKYLAEVAKLDKEIVVGEWSPVMVVCPRCGMLAPKIAGEVKPNRVIDYDLESDKVYFRCNSCGYSDWVPLSSARVKLSWRIDWAAKWFIFKVTCEPAGKDHCVRGGAYDMALEICREVFGYEGPVKVPYEWFTFGGKAMKTHKGITFTPREWLEVAPPEVLRFLVLSTDPMRHIDFVPEKVPNLVDSFDTVERIYFGLEKPRSEADEFKARVVYPLCVPEWRLRRKPARVPYRLAVYLVQLGDLLGEDKVLMKAMDFARRYYDKPELDEEDVKDIKRRLYMASNWVRKYAPDRMRFSICPEVPESIKKSLSPEQRQALKEVANVLETEELSEVELQNRIFKIASDLGIEAPKVFQAVYLVLLGKPFGPRLAPLLLALDREWLVKRLRDAIA